MISTNKFVYKKRKGITALSVSFSNFQYKKHCHEGFAIGVTSRGMQQFDMSGSSYTSGRGGIFLFNPEQAHDGRTYDDGSEYVMLYMDTGLISDACAQKSPLRFTAPLAYNRQLEQHILNLVSAIFHDEEDARCSELLLTLMDNFSQSERGGVYKNNKLINRAKEMMYEKLDHVCRLEDISGEFGISKFQFIRAFKANTGMSPYQYFLNCKVERAKRLIEKNRDIYLAVTECGFVDLTHLNKHFKRVYGVTAFEYLVNIG